jgi:predicted DNA binding CopG/RHH family protein
MNKIILDDYEKEIEKALARGEFVRAPGFENTKKIFKLAAKNYKELQTSKSITLRVNKGDLIKIKARASQSMIPYQTLINLLLRQYLRGQTRLSL